MALAAGLVTSQAQVYSLNVVGYINITLKPGYNLIANQLVNGTNGLGQVFPSNTPEGATLFKWNFATQSFRPADTFLPNDFGGWVDQFSSPSTTTVSPGEGFFLQNPTAGDVVITLTGQVTTGNNLSVTVSGPGYGFYSSIVPDGANFSANGFPATSPAQDGMTYFGFQNGSYTAALTYLNADFGGWVDQNVATSVPQPAVGAGFLINNPVANLTWTRNFNP
jgi:hypothetical protein